jgi:sulfite dehydrogenase
VLLVLATVAVGATGCFSSKVASTTISGEITVGEGSTAQTVTPSTASGSESTAASTEDTAGTESTESSSSTEDSGGSSSTGATTGGGSGADLAAGKDLFTSTCGGCHSLKDAGTTGNVGPDLDSLAPLTVERVATQIKNGGGAMPPGLLSGKNAANTAAYVASVAGK